MYKTHCMKQCSKCHMQDPDCVAVETTSCQSGCDCQEGYLFDGVRCVLPSDCYCLLENNEILEVLCCCALIHSTKNLIFLLLNLWIL